jgi:FkbM family methyltransferase
MDSDFKTGRNYVYGLGSFAERVVNALSSIGVQVDGLIDHVEKMPIESWSIPCVTLSELKLGSEDNVFLGVCNLYGDLKGITKNILAVNPKVRIISPVRLALYLNSKGFLFTNYWLTGDLSIYESSNQDIKQFENLLTDLRSKTILHSIIEYRTQGLIEKLALPDTLSDQYLPSDLPTPPKKLEMLELGSFRGEDLVRFHKRGYELVSGLALEPDSINYLKLVENLKSNEIPNIVPLPLGAWSSTTNLRFNAKGVSGAHLEADGDEMVSVSRPDDLANGISINYIKMDIEGAEGHAIDGARGIIGKNVPHLAISVYHEPSHLWELGLKINTIVPEKYEFYLRTYGHQTFDTVLYCIPR